MKFSRSLLAAVAGGTLATTAFAADAASDVLDLTKDTFKSVVDPESLILVEFFAPWCGHCQALAPQLETAATALKAEGIPIAKVDCTEQEALCTEQEVGGYPTLKLFRKGTPSEYGGTRKSDGIISYMKKQALPAVSTLTSSNLTEFKTKDRIVAIAYLSEGDSKDKQTFSDIADKHRDNYLFGVVSDPEAIKEAGVSTPALVLHRQFDEPEVKYSGKFDVSDIVSFLSKETIPLIDEVGPENFMAYAEAGLPLAYYFADPEDTNRESIVESLKPLAKELKGKLNFVWIDAVKFINHAKGLNLKGEEWPSFAIQDIQATTKYPLDVLGKDPVKTVTDFVKQYTAGKLKPSIKSEPIPKDQDGPVHVLVSDEFDKTVYDDKKDVLVEFYAPWCGHCKNLAPTYDTLGEKYSAHKDKLVIAKMDATANDIPPSAGFQVQSFPTIKFKPAGSKAFIDFNGDRTLEGFIDFIGTNAKNKVTPAADNDTAKEAAGHVHEEL
ncbi:unnamed protein product [Sympodiomycopsis kandeliae]